MKLERAAKQYYDPGPQTSPAVDPAIWYASFDYGDTWSPPSVVEGGRPKWLVAGPEAEPSGAVAVIDLETTRPMLRAVDVPEIIVIDGPYIWLT